MGATIVRKRSALASALVISLTVACAGAVTAGTMSAYGVDITGGLLCGAAALLLYLVPATLFEWPRLTLDMLWDATLSFWDWATSRSVKF